MKDPKYITDTKIVLASELWEKLKEEREAGKLLPKYYTGLPTIDAATEGLKPGNIMVISGPTGHGKTALARTMTKNMIDAGTKLLWFSYEETHEELFAKMPVLSFKVPEQLDMEHVEWVKNMILRAKEDGGCDVVFIDNLDFLKNTKASGMPEANMASYVGSIVQSLKVFAVEQEVAIVLLVHIRKNNWGSNNLPTDEDIRDSGMIPQLATFTMFIIRLSEKEDENGKIYSDTSMIGLRKNRYNGKTAKIFAVYDEDRKVFAEVDKRFQPSDVNDRFNSL